jgi:hypothetical protein
MINLSGNPARARWKLPDDSDTLKQNAFNKKQTPAAGGKHFRPEK